MMAKYVNADGMKWLIETKRWENYLTKDATLNLLNIAIDAAPTEPIDAIEIVRCKDCDNWCKEMKVGRPEFNNVTAPCSEWSDQENGMARHTREDDWCSYGERKQHE